VERRRKKENDGKEWMAEDADESERRVAAACAALWKGQHEVVVEAVHRCTCSIALYTLRVTATHAHTCNGRMKHKDYMERVLQLSSFSSNEAWEHNTRRGQRKRMAVEWCGDRNRETHTLGGPTAVGELVGTKRPLCAWKEENKPERERRGKEKEKYGTSMNQKVRRSEGQHQCR
jgi:hypothetical protein